jgi:hypothetical protein
MNNANHAIDLLAAAAQEYAPRKVGDGVARLEELDLFIDVRQRQAMDAGFMAVFISEFNASTRQRQKGITITSVGRAGDMPSAVGDAVAQWPSASYRSWRTGAGNTPASPRRDKWRRRGGRLICSPAL